MSTKTPKKQSIKAEKSKGSMVKVAGDETTFEGKKGKVTGKTVIVRGGELRPGNKGKVLPGAKRNPAPIKVGTCVAASIIAKPRSKPKLTALQAAMLAWDDTYAKHNERGE
jgi:hypothetical protein